jgi:hypothetical protein
MNRAKYESKVETLTSEQREQEDKWLFEERKTNEEVAQLCNTQFGTELSKSGVGRYRLKERKKREMTALVKTAAEAGRCHASGATNYDAALEAISATVVDLARDSDGSPENTKAVSDFMRVLTAARREANQAKRVAFEQIRLEWNVATACMMHQMEIAAIMSNEDMDQEQQVEEVRKVLFGANAPMNSELGTRSAE